MQLRRRHGNRGFDVAAAVVRFVHPELRRTVAQRPDSVVTRNKQGVDVDDVRTESRVLDFHVAELGSEQPLVESRDIVAGEVTI